MFAADPIHDLQLVGLLGHVCHEVEEVIGLPVEPQGIEAPKRKRRITNPAVAVVPVSLGLPVSQATTWSLPPPKLLLVQM
jgi:hypothetical protein